MMDVERITNEVFNRFEGDKRMPTNIRRASFDEKLAYANTAKFPVNGLYGIVDVGSVDGFVRPCIVENLPMNNVTDPRYEVLAPDGYHFTAEGSHTLVCFDSKDIIERLSTNKLEACDMGCDCQLPPED